MEIKAVFLDIDDTLLDFQGYVKKSMKDGFEKFGFPRYEESMYQTFLQINTSLWHDLELGKLSFSELKRIRWSLVLKALKIDFDGEVFEDFFRKVLFTSAIPVDGAMELLEYLSKKYLLFAASNGPFDQQMNRLKIGNMLPFFTDFFISEKIGYSKPSFEFFDVSFKKVSERIPGILPQNIIMIGDSVSSDIDGANSYGMKSCFFNKKGIEKASEIRSDFYVDDLKQIKNIL